ncbi:hypothetical protein F164LOC_14260 [Pectobacterium carotovorum]|nr:hypothetical protein F164LOC_14260 [Pectobacterium carotovorum]
MVLSLIVMVRKAFVCQIVYSNEKYGAHFLYGPSGQSIDDEIQLHFQYVMLLFSLFIASHSS